MSGLDSHRKEVILRSTTRDLLQRFIKYLHMARIVPQRYKHLAIAGEKRCGGHGGVGRSRGSAADELCAGQKRRAAKGCGAASDTRSIGLPADDADLRSTQPPCRVWLHCCPGQGRLLRA